MPSLPTYQKGDMTMKKSEQIAMNEAVVQFLNDNPSIRDRYAIPSNAWQPLRSCSAEVARIGTLYVLRSYNTIVAAIDIESDTCYDFLRYVYGYTSTSASHISKFSRDYGRGYYGCTHRLTYKEV